MISPITLNLALSFLFIAPVALLFWKASQNVPAVVESFTYSQKFYYLFQIITGFGIILIYTFVIGIMFAGASDTSSLEKVDSLLSSMLLILFPISIFPPFVSQNSFTHNFAKAFPIFLAILYSLVVLLLMTWS